MRRSCMFGCDPPSRSFQSGLHLCRALSVLRMKEDGGPRQVRDKFGVGRFGKEGLSPAEQAVVMMMMIRCSS